MVPTRRGMLGVFGTLVLAAGAAPAAAVSRSRSAQYFSTGIETAPAGSVFRTASTKRPTVRADIGVEFVTDADPRLDNSRYPLDTWLRPDAG